MLKQMPNNIQKKNIDKEKENNTVKAAEQHYVSPLGTTTTIILYREYEKIESIRSKCILTFDTCITAFAVLLQLEV